MLLLLAALSGCQKSEEAVLQPPSHATSGQPDGPSDSQEPFVAKRPGVSHAEPGTAVREFLEAVCSGDDTTATALLTTKAQYEAWRYGLAISGEGFPHAEFDVSEVEYLDGNQSAHVMSTWTDVDLDGLPRTFQCVWILRREAHGWAIAGMATKFLEGADPVILNFENQTEMTKQQRWAEQQIALAQQRERAAQPHSRERPGDPDAGQPADHAEQAWRAAPAGPAR
jgi:hypothetical protein